MITNQNFWTFTWYIRDAQGNIMATYNETHFEEDDDYYACLTASEMPMYGSARLGVQKVYDTLSVIQYVNQTFDADSFYTSVYENIPITLPDANHVAYHPLYKQYELSNHLGNVLATISARPRLIYDQNENFLYKEADVTSVSDYYPFGMMMPSRHWQSDSYRFGFNGMEADNELKGNGNSYDFGARIYDARVGRWLNVDPWQKKYPDLNPYNSMENKPIIMVDENGKGGTVTLIYQGGTLVQVQVDVTIYMSSNNPNINVNQVSNDLQANYQAQFATLPNQVRYKGNLTRIVYNVAVIPVSGGTAGLQQQMDANNNSDLVGEIKNQYNYINVDNTPTTTTQPAFITPRPGSNNTASNNTYTFLVDANGNFTQNDANKTIKDILDIPYIPGANANLTQTDINNIGKNGVNGRIDINNLDAQFPNDVNITGGNYIGQNRSDNVGINSKRKQLNIVNFYKYGSTGKKEDNSTTAP